MNITFVIPVYNERETLKPLVEGIAENIGPHECRILFVDDGSTDGSDEVLRDIHRCFPSVDVIRFRRNFGKSPALAAGFAKATGDIVITMDGDLQDDPKEIPRFVDKINEGYDVVVGWKAVRRDPWHKTFPSRNYNRLVSWLFGVPLHDVNCGFKAFRAEVVRNIRVYGEMHRLIPVLAANLGYKVTEIPVEHHPRRHGKSKYGVERFSRGAIDVLSVMFLSRYLHNPGHLFTRIGVWAIALAVVCACATCIEWLVFKMAFWGLIHGCAAVGLLVGGIVIVALGLIAELLVAQHPLKDPTPYIAEELMH